MTTQPIAFIGAGPGDPELITLKGRRLLDEADLIIYAGSLVNKDLLTGLTSEIHDSASLNLDQIIELIRDGFAAGKKIVRLHTGDPAIYGAIREQMQRLQKHHIPYTVVPGVSSATAAAAALQVELTVPEITQTVILTRQAGRTPVPEKESLKKLAAIQASMCIFLSVSMIESVVGELMAGGYPADTPIAVVEKASWPEQRIIRGDLSDIASKVQEGGIKKTAMILVGQALNEEPDTVSKLYDKRFSHEYR
ncbi:MAG: precorrin-4 C(11)-methyltransferase [Desulfobulbaceae bacterium]|nr:precorrin-4 C(11)-methyltransferase [Desulfobulbaceae bacterium]